MISSNFSIIPSHLKDRNVKLIFSILLMCFYFIIFSRITRSVFTDTAVVDGDSRDYQSLGVNFAKGHGFPKNGPFEDAKQYKFDSVKDSTVMKRFMKQLNTNNFYRTPGYPLFVGIIYKIFGVSPFIVKYIQLLLLIIVAGFLPWIGYHFWQNNGFISGLIASPLYIINNYLTAANILSESLITFSLFLILILYIYSESRKTTFSFGMLGISFGIGLLIKGSLIFIPPLFFLYLGIKYYKTPNKKDLKKILIIFSFFVLTILPWSLYASLKTNSFVLLSTQTEKIIMHSNNEDCIDGDWHHEWKNIGGEKYFYTHDGMENASSSSRVLNFYNQNINLLPEIMIGKIQRGFASFTSFLLILLLYIVEFYALLLNKYFKNIAIHLFYVFFSIVFIVLLLGFKFNLPFNFNCIKMLFLLILPSLFFFREKLFKVPVLFYIYFINLLLITIIFSGEPRYVGVMSFIFILISIQYSVELILSLFQNNNEIEKNHRIQV